MKLKKYNLLITFSCLFLIIIFNVNPVSSFEIFKNNIMNQMEHQNNYFNQIYKNFAYYAPDQYQIINENNQVQLIGNDTRIIVHFGTNQPVNININENINKNFKKEYEYLANDGKYIYIWEYSNTQNLVILGQNDRYIEGIVLKNKQINYLIEMAKIFSSIKEE